MSEAWHWTAGSTMIDEEPPPVAPVEHRDESFLTPPAEYRQAPPPIDPHEDHSLSAARAAEAEMRSMESEEASLLQDGRLLFGVTGKRERIPLRAALAASWLGQAALVQLSVVTLAVVASSTAISAAAPLAKLSLGSSGFAGMGPGRLLFLTIGAFASVAGRSRIGRPAMAWLAALLCAGSLAGAGLADSPGLITLAAIGIALAEGIVVATVLPVLIDGFRPEVRARAAGAWVTAVVMGTGLGRLAVVLATGAGFTWRAALLGMAVVPGVAGLASLSLKDPTPGFLDRDRVRRLVRLRVGDEDADGGGSTDISTERGATERLRRSVSGTSSRVLLVAAGASGAYLVSLQPFLDQFLRDRWALVSSSRSLLLAGLPLLSAPFVLWWAARSEPAFRAAPRQLAQRAAEACSVAAVSLAVAVVCPVLPLTVVLLVVALSAAGAVMVAAGYLLLVECDPRLRNHAAAVLAVVVMLGGPVASLLGSTIGDRFGEVWAVVAIAAAMLLVASSLSKALFRVDRDVDSVVNRVVEQQELASRVRLGHHLPLLSCRHVDFSYGQLQVLFGVSFTVDEGEMVALLGTNGAGKSTLLRVVSGLGTPSAGAIHYQGTDITFLGADKRVEQGISQIPGGKAVFGPLSVTENLRAYGYVHGRQKAKLDSSIDEVFAAFPRLGERRNQLASTLSGGEQQMLALGKAFILKPKLLLIDELSLGLAPIVVGELLEMVRQINEAGTAVVLVEQSVNIALSVVHHAYFMEKGAVRFDGPAQELLDRPDLLRSVFLQGASKSMADEGAS